MTHELPSEHPQVVGARLCAEHQSQRAQTNFVIRFFIQGKLLRLVFDTAALPAAVMNAQFPVACSEPMLHGEHRPTVLLVEGPL